jgi:hypothetical protein
LCRGPIFCIAWIGYKAAPGADQAGGRLGLQELVALWKGIPMSDDAGPPGLREARARERALRGALLALAVSQLGLGLWMAASPGTFFRIAGFGARNDHYIRDVSTFYLALGVVLAIAARRPSWRVPTLAFAAVEYGLHFLNHLVDVGNGHPGWVGPLDAASVGAGAAAFAVTLAATWRWGSR